MDETATAISAGDLSTTVRDEVHRILRENEGKRPESLRTGLQRLLEAGAIDDREVGQLAKLVELFFGARGSDDAAEAALETGRIYRRMLATPGTNPTALAIASLANGAFAPRERAGEGTARLEIIPENAGAGAIVGGILGAIVGGVVGGVGGAAAGAAIGGAAGAGIGASNDSED